MEALVLAVVVLAAEAPRPEPGAEVEAAEAGAAEVKPTEAAAKKKAPARAPVPKEVKKAPELPPPPKPYFVSIPLGVSFPFAGGTTGGPRELRFEWPAFEWGIEGGMEMPNAEVRLSFDSRTYHIEQVGGNWICDRLVLCGGWRVQFLEMYEFAIGGGLGAIWNNADRGSSTFYEDILEDKHAFAGRLYACLRYMPDWPVEIELYGRLTFARADYDIIVPPKDSSSIDLSAGEFGLAVRGRF